ncbi:hypothetical protein DL239_01345 [Sedimentitalea sp. CY04]|uniref:Uncharacterized protein n=1 Tax=Parasedimentitalea denitrificans TaxID=2211118 RepID=A0ABX0W485_9RHOB|nr:hypothetical protein [Sedimentitalea sp. CY04]NIZ59614.1 hypothetical protein [Sedimentitalea sp. CY04]
MRSNLLVHLVIALISTSVVIFAGSAHAVPVLINYDELRPKTYEDFEDEPVGGFLNPGTFETFSFTAGSPMIAELETICRSAGRCLSDNDLLSNRARQFSNLHSGTKAFGVHLGWVNPNQFSTLAITVVGAKSTRTFSGFSTSNLTSKLAFYDKYGLKSLTFERSDLPGPFLTNYSFDNVVTSVRPVLVPVPLTAAGWLLSLSTGAMVLCGLLKSREFQKNHMYGFEPKASL